MFIKTYFNVVKLSTVALLKLGDSSHQWLKEWMKEWCADCTCCCCCWGYGEWSRVPSPPYFVAAWPASCSPQHWQDALPMHTLPACQLSPHAIVLLVMLHSHDLWPGLPPLRVWLCWMKRRVGTFRWRSDLMRLGQSSLVDGPGVVGSKMGLID